MPMFRSAFARSAAVTLKNSFVRNDVKVSPLRLDAAVGGNNRHGRACERGRQSWTVVD